MPGILQYLQASRFFTISNDVTLADLERKVQAMRLFCTKNRAISSNRWGIEFCDLSGSFIPYRLRLIIRNEDNGHLQLRLIRSGQSFSVDVMRTHLVQLTEPTSVATLLTAIMDHKLDRFWCVENRGERFWLGDYLNKLVSKRLLANEKYIRACNLISKRYDVIEGPGTDDPVVKGNYHA